MAKATTNRWVVTLWTTQPNAKVGARSYQRFDSAEAFARGFSERNGMRAMLHTPQPDERIGPEVAVYAKGELQRPVVTTHNESFPRAQRLLAWYEQRTLGTHDTHAHTTTTTDEGDTDMGIDVAQTTKKKGERKTRARVAIPKGKLSWDELLALSDLAVKQVDMANRPSLPKGVEFDDNFCDAYARFLSGSRRTHPGSQKRGFSLDALEQRRTWVRSCIAKGKVGKPPFSDTALKPSLRKDELKPKPAPKVATTTKAKAPKAKATTQKVATTKPKVAAVASRRKATTSKKVKAS